MSHTHPHKQPAPPLKLQLMAIVLLAVIVTVYHYNNPEWVNGLFGQTITQTTSPQSETEAVVTPLEVRTVTPALPDSTHSDFREISRGDTSKKQAIITFDAGSGTKSYEGIMAALAKHKIKGTFFLVGKWVEEHPDLTRRIIEEGHEIFNHSYSHPYYTQLTSEEIKIDLQKMDDVLYAVDT